jgi:hypothetical protein
LPCRHGLRGQRAVLHPVPRQAQPMIADEVQQEGTVGHAPVYV